MVKKQNKFHSDNSLTIKFTREMFLSKKKSTKQHFDPTMKKHIIPVKTNLFLCSFHSNCTTTYSDEILQIGYFASIFSTCTECCY